MTEAPLSELYEEKAAVYATFGNGTVLRAAREALGSGGSILDVGCASGGLLAALRPHATHTAGIELSPTAAAEAATVADAVVCASIDDPSVPFAPASFDVVVLADVVEHLLDPDAALARALEWLRPGGTAIVSVPNITHWQARLTVLRGQWPRAESGTFDASHLRFFTVEHLHSLMAGAGLAGVVVEPVVPRLEHHLRVPGRLRPRAERLWQAAGRRRPNLLGFQLVATGRKPA